MNPILTLSDLELLIVAYLRKQLYPITVNRLIEDMDRDKEVIINAILNLKVNNYIKQTDVSIEQNIFWNSEEACYETNAIKREEIDEILEYQIRKHTVTIKGNYIWYVTYGADLLYEKFLHYIKGGICQFNHKEYYGCTDQTEPLASRIIVIPYEAYVGNSSPSWNYKGVMFLDTDRHGETLGRMYLVTAQQYEEIRDQEGRSSLWYDKEVELGEHLGIPIKTVTSKERKIVSVASSKYQGVVEAGIKEAYPKKNEEEIAAYLERTFAYQVEINHSDETLKARWEEAIAQAKKLSKEERTQLLTQTPKKPKRIITTTTCLEYSPVVIAQRLALAEGKCEKCGKEAPFISAIDGMPYLEVHHIKPIKDGGEDTLENTTALCPNCHREVHLGKKI